MKGDVTTATDVLEVLLDPAVQKEMKRIQPKFNATALVNEILEAWPGGQKGFAQSVYQVFANDRPGGSAQQATVRAVIDLIVKETANTTTRPIEDMTEAELAAVIQSAVPALAKIRESVDGRDV